MVVEFSLLGTIAVALGIILGTWALIYLYARWRHARALARARELAERLRRPASTFDEMERQSQALEELSEFSDTEAGSF